MGYSVDVVNRARAELARQRGDRESENAARLQQAYAQVPRLREIDIQLRRTMAKAAQAVFAQGGDAQAAMEQAKQENLSLQAERKALETAHFAPGWLEGEPICCQCGGTGYVGSTMCDCLKKLCIAQQRKALGSVFGGNERFETFDLQYYPDTVIPSVRTSPRALMEKNLNYCREYARRFSPEAGNLLMVGGTGLGKTHLALSIGRAVGEQGYSVCYETAAGIFSKLEKAKFYSTEESRAQAEKIEHCDLLIIDDLGTELPGQFVTASLYALVNQRLMEGKPMIITTNLNVNETGERYSPQIASRLYGDFHRMTFLGSDIRVLRNRSL